MTFVTCYLSPGALGARRKGHQVHQVRGRRGQRRALFGMVPRAESPRGATGTAEGPDDCARFEPDFGLFGGEVSVEYVWEYEIVFF